MTNPIDGTCPGCGAHDGVQPQLAPPTVQAWTCSCGLDFAVTVVNPTVRVALTVIGLLPTPQQRTAALLDLIRAEVNQRAANEHRAPWS